MPAPNDTNLVNVSTRDVAAPVSNNVLSLANPFEVVIETEAGSAIFGGGTAYETGIVVNDSTSHETIHEETIGPGNMGDAKWPTQKNEFVYQVPAAALAGRVNHVCVVIAWLRNDGESGTGSFPVTIQSGRAR